ncbi:MAG: CHASE2 domain-containing protein [Hormoscilla sp.]
MWQKLQGRIEQWRVPLITAPSIAFLVSAGSFLGAFQLLEEAVRDEFFRRRPLDPPSEEIVVVTIDEPDIAAVGDWPIPDGVLAELLSKVRSQQPAVIGMDMFRDLPEEPGHEQLLEVFRTMPNLIGVEKIIGNRVGPPPVLQELGQVALANVILDSDGNIRRALLSAQDGNEVKLTLATRVALMYLETQGITLEMFNEEQQKLKLGQAIFTPLKSGDAGYREKDDLGGYQILMNWRGPITSFETVSMTSVLTGQVEPGKMRDRIVLIGSSADSVKDFFQTPYSGAPFAHLGPMPGVVVHANLASQIISSALSGRPLMRGLTAMETWLWISIWSVIGVVGTWLLESKKHQQRQLIVSQMLLANVGAGLLLIGTAYLVFLQGTLLPVVAPLTALSLGAIVTTNLYKQWELKLANSQLAAANQQLEEYSRTLEYKVEERTVQLKEAKEEAEAAKEAADAANSAKSQFLSSMSHELRTPLNGILGYAQIFQQDRSLDKPQKDGINVIHQCGTHLLELINDILDLSKIEARKMELYPKEIHLPTFLQGVIEMCRIKASQKGISFTYEGDRELPEGIYEDEKRLRQVLINLLGNAIKFTDNGGVTLQIKIMHDGGKKESEPSPNLLLRFQVEDTGVGMSPEQVAKIFLPFEQVGETSRRSQGTGLGLAISQQIAEMMGANIQVRSFLGAGTTFWFDLDVPAINTSQATDTDLGIIKEYVGKQRKILLVDDNWENKVILRRLLEPIGFIIWEAGNGEEGLEMASKKRPDLIISDMFMPVMDGVEMIRRLRSKAEFKQLPIIASSASAYESDRQKSREAGCDDFLPKPIVTEHLLEKLQAHLKLEWIYEQPIETVQSESKKLAEIVPPAEVLTEIYELSRGGLFFNIEDLIAKLQQEDDKYIWFAQKILQFTEEFEGEKIQLFLEPYLSDRS